MKEVKEDKTYKQKHTVSNETLLHYVDYVDWSSICEVISFTDEQLELYKDKIKWFNLSIEEQFTEEQLTKYLKYIHVDRIYETQDVSEEFIEQHYCVYDLPSIIKTQDVSEEFLERHLDDISDNYSAIRALCSKELSLDFILKHIDILYKHLDIISMYTKLPIDIIRKYYKCFNWGYLSRMYTFTEEEIEEFKESVKWSDIFKEQKLSEEFKRKYEYRLFLQCRKTITTDTNTSNIIK